MALDPRLLCASVLLLLSFFLTPVVARAQAATAPSKELTTLERDLGREVDALSTSDCAVACRALASIRRAADRICALDPDTRCAAARAKADEAAERVKRACPQCAIDPAPTPAPPAPAPMAKPAPEREQAGKAGSAESVSTASAPPAESKRGGCAGCAVVTSSPIDPRAAGLAVAAVVLLLLRRLRRVDPRLRSKT